MHGHRRAAASLCFVLAAQARKLSLSAALGWAQEAQNRHARNRDGVYGHVRAAASLCFVLAAQARRLSLSAALGWAQEAQKRHARNSDGDAAIVKS